MSELDKPDKNTTDDPSFYGDLWAHVPEIKPPKAEFSEAITQELGSSPERAITLSKAEFDNLRSSGDKRQQQEFVHTHGLKPGWNAWVQVEGVNRPVQIYTDDDSFGLLAGK